MFKDDEASVDGTYWSTATVGTNSTVANAAGVTTLTHSNESATRSAKYYSKHAYKIDKTVARFRFKTSTSVAFSERFIGLGLSDLSEYVCIHLSGASTKEFICNDGSGTAVSALTDDLTAYGVWEIVWATGSAKLYLDRTLKATITTHVPTDDLLLLFAEQKI